MTVLSRDIAGWGPELYKQLMQYGVDNGATPEEMEACVDPAIFKMMHKAMQFDKGAQTVKAKIKSVIKQPTKVVKNSAKSEKPSTDKKAALLKRVGAGMSTKESDMMFSMLED